MLVVGKLGASGIQFKRLHHSVTILTLQACEKSCVMVNAFIWFETKLVSQKIEKERYVLYPAEVVFHKRK